MTTTPSSFLRLAARRIRTTARIARLAPAYGSFALLKHLQPAARLARWAWRPPATHVERDGAAEARAIAVVSRLRRLFGSDRGDCLEAALVLYRELSRVGADPQLVMGFGHDKADVVGHAWVEVDGAAVGDIGTDGRFVPTVRFGARGERLS